MSNPLKGESSVTLEDGRTLTLAFDVNAWIDIEGELGLETPEIIKALQNKENPPGLKFQRIIIWGGLRKYHPEMTLRDAGEVMAEAAEAMAKGLQGGLPQAEEAIEEDEEAEAEAVADPPRRVGTGTRR